MDSLSTPFGAVAAAWTMMIDRAKQVKERRFGVEAKEGMRFYCGPYDFYFDQISSDRWFRPPATGPAGQVRVTVNKVADLVEIFGPNLYQRNPTRRATTRKIPNINPNAMITDPMMHQLVAQVYQMSAREQMTDQNIGQILECLLNVTPDKLDLKEHSRWAIDEALIKGLGILVHEYRYQPDGKKVCGSFWKSVDYFLMDPDATNIKDIRWCAIGTPTHVWEAERKFRLPPGSLHGTQAGVGGSQVFNGSGNPLSQTPSQVVTVWEVYSKMGVGGRLPQIAGMPRDALAAYEVMGDYCYLAIVESHPWPLNLPPEMFHESNVNRWQQAKKAIEWPTPFWRDSAWPFTPFYFHTIANDPWPMSHLTPAMGYLKFLNWAYSKMASKIAVTSRDILFVLAEISEDAKATIKYGPDLSVVPLEGLQGKSINEYIQQFQHNQWNEDLWKVIQAVSQGFDDATGLTELLYGQSARQMRSAAEADRKYDQVNVRPDDMASKVEDAMSACGRREAWCSRWHYDTKDVHSLIGIAGAFAWEQLVLSQPPTRVLDLQIRVESDSTKKPSKGTVLSGLTELAQFLAPMYFQAAQAGMLDPFNNFVGDLLENMGIPNRERYLLQMPPVAPIPVDPNQQAANESRERMAREKPAA